MKPPNLSPYTVLRRRASKPFITSGKRVAKVTSTRRNRWIVMNSAFAFVMLIGLLVVLVTCGIQVAQ
jgi:hypothetical protein